MAKQQYNPDTSMASYNPGTSLAQATSIGECICAGTWTATFTGVAVCAGESWPSTLNTSFACAHQGGCEFIFGNIADVGSWIVFITCDATTPNTIGTIQAAYSVDFPADFHYGFGILGTNEPVASPTNPISSPWVIGDCGGTFLGYPIVGYGGSVTLTYSA